jgi:hypothetical protein
MMFLRSNQLGGGTAKHWQNVGGETANRERKGGAV